MSDATTTASLSGVLMGGEEDLPGGPSQPVVKVRRPRERGIFRRIKAEIPQMIRESSRPGFRVLANEESVEKARSQLGRSFATGCYTVSVNTDGFISWEHLEIFLEPILPIKEEP